MKDRKGFLKNMEFYVLVGMLAFCAVLCWQIQKITIEESKILPLFILFIAAMSAVAQFFSVLRGKASRSIREVRLRKKECAALGVLLTAVIGYRYLGFYTTISILLIVISLLVQNKLDRKTIRKVLLYDVILMLITYFCFSVLLGMVTPAGLLI